MASVRSRLTAALVTTASTMAVLGAASAAVANDQHNGDLPVMIVSPAPGKITKEHKVTDTYQFDPKGGSASADSSSQPPMPAQPGPLTAVKDTVNDSAQSAISGASSSVDSALR